MRNDPVPVKLITGHTIRQTVYGYVIEYTSQSGRFAGRTAAHPKFRDAVLEFRGLCEAAGYTAGL